MKILVLGAYQSSNLGDGVICECVAAVLRRGFPQAKILIRDLIARDRLADRSEPQIKTLEKRRIKTEIRRAVTRFTPVDLVLPQQQRRVEEQRAHLDEICSLECDMVVFAGGQMFMDLYALFLEYCLIRFEQRGIPVFFNACGTGPDFSSAIARRLKAATASGGVKWVSCRDDVDKAQRRYVAENKTVVPVADPALRTAQVYEIEKAPGADTIGLGVIYPKAGGFRGNLRFWQGIIRELERQGRKWKIFTNGDPADLAFGREVLASMPEFRGREDGFLCPRDREPEELVRTISNFSGLISFRLHSHIIAASLDIPTVAVVWDDKLPRFFEKLGYPERCVRVSTAPERVLEVLDRAQAQGYERGVIEQQAEMSERCLLEAILAEVGEK